MILTHIFICDNPEFLIKLIAKKTKNAGRGTYLGYLPALGKSSVSLGTRWVGNESGDLWCGMVPRNSQRL